MSAGLEHDHWDGDGDPTTTGDGDPTTTGDGDPTTTGDGDGDGDPTTTGDGDPFMCQLEQNCSELDPNACVCEGCNTNGFCSQNEDCVCPDCTNEPVCSGDNCVDTGNCFPFYEGCSCADCVNHPLCG